MKAGPEPPTWGGIGLRAVQAAIVLYLSWLVHLTVSTYWPWLDRWITTTISLALFVWILVRGPRWFKLWFLTIAGTIAVMFVIVLGIAAL